MKPIQLILKNTIFLYVSQIISTLLTVFFTITFARILGDTIFGEYSFALSFIALFSIPIDLEFSTFMARDIARDRSVAPKYLGNILVIKAILSITVFGLILMVINLMGRSPETVETIIVFSFYIILNSFANTFRAVFLAFEKMEYIGFTTALILIIRTSLGFAALISGYGLIQIAYIFVLSSAFDVVLSFIICKWKFTTPKIEIDLDLWRKAATVATPMAIGVATIPIFTQIDTIILSALKGDAVVGWYSAAYKLVLTLRPIPIMVGTALFPMMSALFVSSIGALKFTYATLIRYMFYIGLPLATGTMLLSIKIIPFFYGEKFANSINVLQILAWDILLFFIYIPLWRILIAIEKQRQSAIACGICAVLTCILDLILIPYFSLIGSAIATIAAESILVVLCFYFVSHYFHSLPLHKIVIKPAVACIIMALFIQYFININLIVLILLAVIIYFGVLYMIKGFTQTDIVLFKQAIKTYKVRRK